MLDSLLINGIEDKKRKIRKNSVAERSWLAIGAFFDFDGNGETPLDK